MDIYLVKAGFETTLESTVFLPRFVLGKIWIPECHLKMMLNRFEEWEDFADSRDFRLWELNGCIMKFLYYKLLVPKVTKWYVKRTFRTAHNFTNVSHSSGLSLHFFWWRFAAALAFLEGDWSIKSIHWLRAWLHTSVGDKLYGKIPVSSWVHVRLQHMLCSSGCSCYEWGQGDNVLVHKACK